MKPSSGKSAPDVEPHLASVCVAGDINRSQNDEESVCNLQRDNSRLQEQLKKSEELNTTLRSELDLAHSIITHTQSQNTMLTKREHTPSSSPVTHTHSQSQATDSQQAQSVHTNISAGTVMYVRVCVGGGGAWMILKVFCFFFFCVLFFITHLSVSFSLRFVNGAPAGGSSSASALGGNNPHQRETPRAAGEKTSGGWERSGYTHTQTLTHKQHPSRCMRSHRAFCCKV